MTVRGQSVNLDLTGTAQLTLGAPQLGSSESDAHGSVTVSGTDPKLGKVTVKTELAGKVAYNSTVDPFPAKLDVSGNFTVSIQENSGNQSGNTLRGAVSAPPTDLSSKSPGQMVGTLNQFPPQGEAYRLQNPIELVLPNSEETIATLDKFPVQVGDLSGN